MFVGRFIAIKRNKATVALGVWTIFLSPPVIAEGEHCLSWWVYRIGRKTGSLLVYSWNSNKKKSLLFEAYGNQIIGELYAVY